eukprot:519802-Pleurochrysis_carterae.AAC.1
MHISTGSFQAHHKLRRSMSITDFIASCMPPTSFHTHQRLLCMMRNVNFVISACSAAFVNWPRTVESVEDSRVLLSLVDSWEN